MGARTEAEHERRRRRDDIVSNVPGWYRPWVHLAIPSVLGLGVAAVALASLRDLALIDLCAIPITLFASFGFEWRAHKDILHKKMPLLGLIYRRHELMHHVIYTYDDMSLRSPRELWLILMPAYAIVLVFLLVTPFAIVVALLAGKNAAMLMLATSMFFFLSYEWLHMAYHLPPETAIGRLRLVRVLREVHRRHHDPRLMKRWNFNVTVPVFDLIHGTLWSAEREAARDRARAGRKAAAVRGTRTNASA
jgi:hypothetical protein